MRPNLQLPDRRVKVAAHEPQEVSCQRRKEEGKKQRKAKRSSHGFCALRHPQAAEPEQSGQGEQPRDWHEINPEDIALLPARQTLGAVGETSADNIVINTSPRTERRSSAFAVRQAGRGILHRETLPPTRLLPFGHHTSKESTVSPTASQNTTEAPKMQSHTPVRNRRADKEWSSKLVMS